MFLIPADLGRLFCFVDMLPMSFLIHKGSSLFGWVVYRDSSITWYNLHYETAPRLSRRCIRYARYERSPGSGTALRHRHAACHGVRLSFVLQVPNLVQVRDFCSLSSFIF